MMANSLQSLFQAIASFYPFYLCAPYALGFLASTQPTVIAMLHLTLVEQLGEILGVQEKRDRIQHYATRDRSERLRYAPYGKTFLLMHSILLDAGWRLPDFLEKSGIPIKR